MTKTQSWYHNNQNLIRKYVLKISMEHVKI